MTTIIDRVAPVADRGCIDRFVTVSRTEVEQATALAANRLPDRVVSRPPIRSRRAVYVGSAIGVAACAVLEPRLTLATGATGLILIYFATLSYRLRLFSDALKWGPRGPRQSGSPGGQIHVPEAVALALTDAQLPVYTVLVPAYGEPGVIGQLLQALHALDYPPEKLDVKLLLEADDHLTIRAVHAEYLAPYIEVLLIPAGVPRTKPKALNVGLLRARGALVTIYDAEDVPEPLQLRRAVAAFLDLDRASQTGRSDVVCLQARLEFFNHAQNALTRWFAIDYLSWFSHMLPALAARRVPVPLGGTSNHFRRDALDEIGGWDPYNVTEDADLGLRLHYLGYRVGALDSVTTEEANSDVVNWIRQRSRWHKGYLQTAAVYLRQPRSTISAFGVKGFCSFLLVIVGTPLLSLVNPFVWSLTVVWIIARPSLIEAMFPPVVYHAGLLCMIVGNVALIYLGVISAVAARRHDLLRAAFTFPAYWLLMSVATVKGTTQLIRRPSYWEKTVHGLSPHAAPRAPRVRSTS